MYSIHEVINHNLGHFDIRTGIITHEMKFGRIGNPIHIRMPTSILDVIEDFYSIASNKKYYDEIDGIRYYLYCQNCGYIKTSQEDKFTEYLDMHCNCGDNVTIVEDTKENILNDIDQKRKDEYYWRFLDEEYKI